MAVDPYLTEQVEIGCRVVAREGYADLTLGHVSVFDPDTERVYIRRPGSALHEAEPDKVACVSAGRRVWK
jgi:ribulose-5-phosphate 4-epimerase/fuculose-1-phosphate aldolase